GERRQRLHALYEQRLRSLALADRECAPQRAQRAVRLPDHQERAGKTVVGIDEIRLTRNRPLKALRGFRESAARAEHDAEAAVDLGELGLERERALVALRRLVQAPLAQQHIAKVGMSIGKA